MGESFWYCIVPQPNKAQLSTVRSDARMLKCSNVTINPPHDGRDSGLTMLAAAKAAGNEQAVRTSAVGSRRALKQLPARASAG